MRFLSALFFLSILSFASATPILPRRGRSILPNRADNSDADGSRELFGFLYENRLDKKVADSSVEIFEIWARDKGTWKDKWFGGPNNAATVLETGITSALKGWHLRNSGIVLSSKPTQMTNGEGVITGYRFALQACQRPADGSGFRVFSSDDLDRLDLWLFPEIFKLKSQKKKTVSASKD